MKKGILIVLGMIMISGSMIGCKNETAPIEEAVEATSVYVTYEFETLDGKKVVIDANNIVSQENDDNPLESALVPADAEVIAPGRDFVYFADETHYYVEDAINRLVTIADKGPDENASAEEENQEKAELVTYEFETYDNESVLLDEASITVQEASENPEESEYISDAAAGNVIAPGRDYVYLADDDNYYVADNSRKLITVADKSKAKVTKIAEENPGAFETDDYSVSYDTEKWYGTMGDNSVAVINCLEAVAGSSYIEIYKSDFATATDTIANIAETEGQDLTEPSQFEMNGYTTYSTWNNIPLDAEGPVIDDFYLVFENDGKVIVARESITRDSDSGRAEELSYLFDDVVATIKIK